MDRQPGDILLSHNASIANHNTWHEAEVTHVLPDRVDCMPVAQRS